MQIQKFSLGQLQANCYFVIDDKDCLIIDPADDANFILEEVMRKGLKVKALLATHGHFDHVMAVGEIQAALPRTPFYIHSDDLFLLKRLKETAKHFLDGKPVILDPRSITSLNVGPMKIGNFSFQVIHTPGHTPGSVSYFFDSPADEKTLFSGDTLFKAAVGRYDHSYSSRDDLKKSLNLLFALPEETIVYPGHGEETLISEEKGSDLSFL